MSLWNRGTERTKEIKKSAELVKKRDELLKTFPAVMEAWEKEDSGPVRQAAQELSIVDRMENRDRILQAKEVLKKAIWKRDGIKQEFQREIDQLNTGIEILSGPVIIEKATEWQNDLFALRDKKIIEKVKTRETIQPARMITFRSNFSTIEATKEKLVTAIRELRSMKQRALAEIYEFIKTTELALQAMDLSALTESEEVTERRFEELCSQRGVTPIYPVGVTYTLVGDKIIKTYK